MASVLIALVYMIPNNCSQACYHESQQIAYVCAVLLSVQ
jgi:hypothetical protein